MKRNFTFFCCILLLLSGRALFAENLFSKYSHIDIYGDDKKTFGINTAIPFGEFRFSVQDEKSNTGLAVSSSRLKKIISINLKTGNLSTGGILSRMNNPLISSASSPFQSGTMSINSITANLPGSTSFSNSFSSFLEINCTPKKSFIKKTSVNCLYSPEEDTGAVSFLSVFSFLKNNLQINFSGAGGFFPFSEQTSSSWFADDIYYHQGNHFCSFYQILISSPISHTILSTGIYETPFSVFSNIYRLDNQINTRHFSFLLSSLYNSNTKESKIITSSDKRLDEGLQFNFGIQYKYAGGQNHPVYVKTALQSYSMFYLSENEHPLKLCAGFQISNSKYALILTGNINACENSSNPTIQNIIFKDASAKIKNTLYFKYLVPSITLAASYNPSDDYSSFQNTYKIAASISSYTKARISATGNFSITQKDNDLINPKFSGSITSKFSWKKINITIKLSGNIIL